MGIINEVKDKGILEKLDDNLFSRKIFKKFYLIFAFWLILSPIIETLFGLLGINFDMTAQNFLIMLFSFITKIVELCFNFKSISFKRNLTDIFVACLFIWFLIVSFVSGLVELWCFITLFFFMAFVTVLNVDKKYYKTIAFVFAIEMIFDSFLSLIDLHNKFIPGFDSEEYSISMQFVNPNWSGFIMIIADILILWFVIKSENNWQKELWFAGFAILTLALFVGGSYSPEFSLICCEIAILIYYWIKNKKCPFWLLSALLLTIFISFFVWFIPAYREVSTANANFFYESLAVIDGKLDTHLVKGVSKFFNKLFGRDIIDVVAGSDGWNREDLITTSFSEITSSAKSFIFGHGVGYLHEKVRVHNCYIGICVVFGTVGLLLYLGILVSLLIRFVRVKKTDKTIIMFMTFVMMLFEKMYCCIEPYCYGFFIILVAFLYKELYSLPLKSELMQKELKDKTCEENEQGLVNDFSSNIK